MTKKEVEICDVCKRVIASNKCEFCGADMCDACISPLGIGTDEKLMVRINSCKNCFEILEDVDLEKEFNNNHKKIKGDIIDIFKKLIQLEELEGNVKPKPRTRAVPSSIYVGTGVTSNRFNAIYPGPRKKYKFADIMKK